MFSKGTCDPTAFHNNSNMPWGVKLASVAVASAAECCGECTTTAGCTHWVYAPGKSMASMAKTENCHIKRTYESFLVSLLHCGHCYSLVLSSFNVPEVMNSSGTAQCQPISTLQPPHGTANGQRFNPPIASSTALHFRECAPDFTVFPFLH